MLEGSTLPENLLIKALFTTILAVMRTRQLSKNNAKHVPAIDATAVTAACTYRQTDFV
jgi:hypothetical protein